MLKGGTPWGSTSEANVTGFDGLFTRGSRAAVEILPESLSPTFRRQISVDGGTFDLLQLRGTLGGGILERKLGHGGPEEDFAPPAVSAGAACFLTVVVQSPGEFDMIDGPDVGNVHPVAEGAGGHHPQDLAVQEVTQDLFLVRAVGEVGRPCQLLRQISDDAALVGVDDELPIRISSLQLLNFLHHVLSADPKLDGIGQVGSIGCVSIDPDLRCR